uniref:Uncharacterized protein n=1 Tax=Sphaeramia orbicularis TaxID=375764 RepID=A0A672ZX20_9TELE
MFRKRALTITSKSVMSKMHRHYQTGLEMFLTTSQDTPVPGLYHVRDFIEESELNPVKKTYGFKGVGRRAATLGEYKGELLLPGAYHYTDSTQEVLKRHMTYSFKNCPRPDISTLEGRDKVGFRYRFMSGAKQSKTFTSRSEKTRKKMTKI